MCIPAIPMTYNEARDEYGKLNKYQRSQVLDLVSQYTDRQTGPEAEQAFVRAVIAVKDWGNCGSVYGGF